MDDLISRRAAIDKINEQRRKLIYCFGFENDMVKIMDIAKSIVLDIPSAQRSKPCENCQEFDCYGCEWKAERKTDDLQ